MKKSASIVSAAALLGAAAFVSVRNISPEPAVVGRVPAEELASAPSRSVPAEAGDNALVSQGQLWETLATSARDRASTTMPVAAVAFQAAQRSPVGSQLKIELSPQIPALAAAVSARSVADDGTTVTRLHISGDVPGTLILQENTSSDFFLGQLYYDGLAVAYEFHATTEGLTATRHTVSDLLCAIVSAKGGAIESLGLPAVDTVKAKNAQDQGLANKDENLIQEGAAKVQAPAAAGLTLSVNDVAVLEGNSGTGKLLFTVKLSKADTRKIITVKYATANGSATAGSDYTAVAGTLSFPKGSTTQTVAVAVTGDTTVETDETFTLKLSSPANATLADASGVGTISNDDSPPVVIVNSALSVNDVAVMEGNTGTGNLVFTVGLSKADSTRIISVNYATADASAAAGSDYTAVVGTLSFPIGSTTQTVAVAITGDTALESDETFTLNLSNPVNATLADASAVGTLVNEDSAPVVIEDSSLSVSDVATLEGNSGTSNLVFTVNLSQADSTRAITVNYTTVDASATAGSDYTAVAGTLSFPIGSMTQTVAVAVMGDTAYESDETFTLNLSDPVNATLAVASAVGTLTNDDLPPGGVPVFNSLPGAVAVAYLDMDGQVDSSMLWSSTPIIARGIATTFTQEQMAEIWQRTTEDFAAFQINVTTQESVYLAAAPNRRIRCIITPDNEWYGGVGGVAYVNSFTWTGDTPCWVFSDQLGSAARYIADSCSHEIGHTLGLGHDGRTVPVETYYQGQGSGEVGWAPIMGTGYYKTLVQWSKGEYLSSNNSQDDLTIITTKNGFSYRVDQHSDTAAGSTALKASGAAVSGSGIIETRNDVDVFSFVTGGGVVTLSVTGEASGQALDILAEIRDASGNLLVADNPDLLTDASVSANLAAGTYFLHVSGVGRGDYLVDGYTDYGSIGQYAITGNVP
jgi:deoxyribose-phosphate aldolase